MFSFGKPTTEQFAHQLIRAIADKHGIEFGFVKDSNTLHQIDGEGVINLFNLYAEHCKLKKKDRQEHLEMLAGVFGQRFEDLPKKFDDAKKNLRPKIWQRATIDFQNLRSKIENGKDGLDLPQVAIGSHLAASLVFDTEHSMRSVSMDNLATWGVTVDRAMEEAIKNLNESTIAFARIGDHFASSISGDAYDSSRILLKDRLASMNLGDELVAIIPSRDSCLVASSHDLQSLEILFKFAEPEEGSQMHERPLSPLPIIFRDDRWEDWEPPKNHKLRKAFEELALNYLGSLYAEQKELLEQLYANDLDAPFVASFSGLEREEDGEILSYAVWSKDVYTLLPKTDLVMLNSGNDAEVIQLQWDDVIRVAGNLVVADSSFYPIRYRVREFPSQQQLAELKP